MVKRKGDEPDNKALQRLRQFEESRKAVPDLNPENDKNKKDKKKDSKKKGKDDQPDKATDELKC